MSFASEPERDDGSLPPVNIVIPDDARELDRDVLAYHREMRARRRRQRAMRLLRPINRSGLGGPTALVPLIALCLALALVGGALLSVVTMTPAATPTITSTPALSPTEPVSGLTTLPAGVDPASVLARAKEILGNLEESELTPEGTVRQPARQRAEREKLQRLAPPPQLDLFG